MHNYVNIFDDSKEVGVFGGLCLIRMLYLPLFYCEGANLSARETYICVCMYSYVCISTCVCMYTYTSKYTCTSICICTCLCPNVMLGLTRLAKVRTLVIALRFLHPLRTWVRIMSVRMYQAQRFIDFKLMYRHIDAPT